MQWNKEKVKNNRLVRKSYYLARGIWKKNALRKKAASVLNRFHVSFPSEEARNRQISDMVRMNMHHGYTFEEYLIYRFAEKPMRERLSFVADWEHLGYTCAMNDPSNAEIYDRKQKTYEVYRDFYQRELLYCEGDAGEQAFRRFTERHPAYIVKPVDASCGRGVQLIPAGGGGECGKIPSYQELLQENGNKFIVEELIRQAEEMAIFHPQSVNTCRVPTIRLEDRIVIVHPFMRLGQHGNIVDNAGAGGIICTFDAETGKVTAAADEYGNHFDVHPDSGKQIVGFTVPKWEEAKQLVRKLAMVVPENRYTGWDLALTDSGWVLVEANRRGQFVWQIPALTGFRDEINQYLKQLGTGY